MAVCMGRLRAGNPDTDGGAYARIRAHRPDAARALNPGREGAYLRAVGPPVHPADQCRQKLGKKKAMMAMNSNRPNSMHRINNPFPADGIHA